MIVILNPDEILLCQMAGRMRSLIARTASVVDAKIGNQDGIDADIMGMMGEYAFSKAFNTFPDLGLSPRSGSADGKIKNKSYDVKTTHYKTGRLLCTLKDNPDVDVYVLAIADKASVNLVGWASKRDLRQEKNLIDLGHGKGYALTQDELHSIEDFYDK
jgi:hypothetical protein